MWHKIVHILHCYWLYSNRLKQCLHLVAELTLPFLLLIKEYTVVSKRLRPLSHLSSLRLLDPTVCQMDPSGSLPRGNKDCYLSEIAFEAHSVSLKCREDEVRDVVTASFAGALQEIRSHCVDTNIHSHLKLSGVWVLVRLWFVSLWNGFPLGPIVYAHLCTAGDPWCAIKCTVAEICR